MAGSLVKKVKRKFGAVWAREETLRGRLGNIAHLMTGNLFGTLLGVTAFLLAARALEPAGYGVLALIYAYTRSIEKIVSFQSWQPLIKYGAELQGSERRDDYRSLLKFGLLVDLSACLLASGLAIGLALVFGPLFGIPPEAVDLVIVYALVLAVQVNGLPTAVLRLAGRFKNVAYGSLVGNLLRVLLCAYGLWSGADLTYFVLAWAGTQAFGALVFLGMALAELRRQGVADFWRASLAGVSKRFPGLWGFTFGANLELTITSSANELDVLLVGWLAGPTGAGLYHVAKRFGRLVLQFGVQVQAVLYPDVARLWAARDYAAFRKAVLQVEVILVGCGLLIVGLTVIGAEALIAFVAGPEFRAAAPLVVMQMVAVTMRLSSSAIRTAMLAMGKQFVVLKNAALGTVVFFGSAFALISLFGPIGANMAHVITGVVFLTGLVVAYRKALARAGGKTVALPERGGAEAVPAGGNAG